MQIYCWATVACLAVLLLALLASRGALLHQFFFHDPSDTGMDFFHSIEYVKWTYAVWPVWHAVSATCQFAFLCAVFASCRRSQSEKWAQSLQSSTNMKGSEQDLRLQQATMLLFIFFVVLVVLGMIAMAERATRGCDGRRDLLDALHRIQLRRAVRIGARQYSAAVLAVDGVLCPVPQFPKSDSAGAGLSGAGCGGRIKALPGLFRYSAAEG